MRSFILHTSACMLLLLLAACNPSTAVKVSAPPDDEAAARGYVELLRQKNLEHLEQSLNPALRKGDTHEALLHMAGTIPPGDPLSITLIGYDSVTTAEYTKTDIALEYQFPERKWFVANIELLKETGGNSIIGFHVNSYPDSQENLNRFTFTGKGPVYYVIFTLALLIPLVILYALVFCICTRITKWKWLWMAFILFGFGSVTLNWTTGQCAFSPFSFQLFGAGCFAPPYGPWTVSISLPAGAILFILRRKKLMEPPASETAE